MDLYDDAFLYDLVHGPIAEAEIVGFLLDYCKVYGSPVLELASGTGSILLPIAEAGIEIRGIDLSENMLQACRRKAAERGIKAKVTKGDIRDFSLGHRYPLIIILGNSFQHLNSLPEISAFFESVKRHLEPDGRLLIEVFNPYIPLLNREMGIRYVVGEFDGHILTEDVNYDQATQVTNLNWHFLHRASGRERSLSFSMRQFFPQEFDELISLHGFEIEDKFGDFDRSPFVSGSPAQLVVAKVRNN